MRILPGWVKKGVVILLTRDNKEKPIEYVVDASMLAFLFIKLSTLNCLKYLSLLAGGSYRNAR